MPCSYPNGERSLDVISDSGCGSPKVVKYSLIINSPLCAVIAKIECALQGPCTVSGGMFAHAPSPYKPRFVDTPRKKWRGKFAPKNTR